MPINRIAKSFASVVLLACLLITCVYAARRAETSPSPATQLAIMQGVTGLDYTQALVLKPGEQSYRYVLIDTQGKELAPHTTSVAKHPSSAWQVQRVVFSNLKPNSSYRLRVYQQQKRQLIDERSLRTLTTTRHRIRLAVASCMDDHTAQGDIWQQMVQLNPDVIFLIGDNVYADKHIDGKPENVNPKPADLWRRYVETRNYIALFKSKKLVPVVAIWDDHDYGMNNSGRNFPYKKESLQVFEAFFASNPSNNYQRAGIGNAAVFNAYGFHFFLLDNRTFRTVAKKSTPQQHFGKQQLQWLWRNISGKDYALLITGGQFFGGYHRFESFEGNHYQAFKQFLNKLKTLNTKVAFVSGDRHITEIMRIPSTTLGYQTYEFTSSPIHGKLYPGDWDKIPNPRQVAAQDLQHNFMLLELERNRGKLSINATSYTKGGKKLFSGNYYVH